MGSFPRVGRERCQKSSYSSYGASIATSCNSLLQPQNGAGRRTSYMCEFLSAIAVPPVGFSP